MKNLSKFLLLLSLVLGIISCNPDDRINKENEITLNGISYPLMDAKMLRYTDFNPIYDYEVVLYNSPLDKEGKPTNEPYNAFQVKARSEGSNTNGLITGSLFAINVEPGKNDSLKAYYVSDGKLKVTKFDDGNYAVKLTGKAKKAQGIDDDTEFDFSGYYRGKLFNSENFDD
ncbi:hypothetical protein [Mesonia sp. K4-1]|uniref:hypothetical protein n=1 Tax=Mesonia sp. K4-1 TaxID=2602760 RepID=UPI0011C8D82E|nr:hypothetical protein [Mesonia sp. K4-1]TXK78809.1 hypothetical protein FT986_03155 [Mesonia sp. K4-1]